MEKHVEKFTRVLDNIICDICGNSCKINNGFEDYEFARLYAQWGYNSKKDGRDYKIDLCEECFDKTIEFLEKNKKNKIKFNESF